MARNIKNLYNKIIYSLTPNYIKRRRLVDNLKGRYKKEYILKLQSFDKSLNLHVNNIFTNENFTNKIYPIFTFEYTGYAFVDTPFQAWKEKLLQKKFCYPKPFEYDEFNDSLIDKLLYYTSSDDKRDIQVCSLLHLFMSSDYSENNDYRYCNLFIDYGLTEYEGKVYTFITYKQNKFLSEIFFKDIAYKILKNQDVSPDRLTTDGISNYVLHTVLLDFNSEKLKYYYVDVEPKLKVLVKLYKDKILDYTMNY